MGPEYEQPVDVSETTKRLAQQLAERGAQQLTRSLEFQAEAEKRNREMFSFAGSGETQQNADPNAPQPGAADVLGDMFGGV